MRSLCVFCGSNAGTNPLYRAEAEKLGRLLAARGVELVYGAGNIGLMGAVADACLEAGGTVIGIIPEALMGKEVAGRAVDHRPAAIPPRGDLVGRVPADREAVVAEDRGHRSAIEHN